MILPPVCLTIEDERILRKQSDATATGVMSMLNIVLVEPEIPQNCGNIARTCAATGCRLHLIRPLGFDISEKAVRRAGLDYWHMVEVRDYENLEDFFAKNQVEEMWCLSTKAPRSYTEAAFHDGCYLFFGKETKGLPEDFLRAHYDACVRICATSVKCGSDLPRIWRSYHELQ